MKKIASFTINHNTLMPGVYISRIDGDITTYDMRFVKPNTPPYLPNPVMHTIEHRSEEHTSELQSRFDLVCRLLLEKKKKNKKKKIGRAPYDITKL